MTLSNLLAGLCPVSLTKEIDITDLSLDSRLIKPGFLFFALQGSAQDGRQFIDEAIQKGAHAVITEAKTMNVEWRDLVPVIAVPNLKTIMAEMAARFYNYPTK